MRLLHFPSLCLIDCYLIVEWPSHVRLLHFDFSSLLDQLIAVQAGKDVKYVQRMFSKESLLEQKWLRDRADCGQGCRGGGQGEQIRHRAGGQEQPGGNFFCTFSVNKVKVTIVYVFVEGLDLFHNFLMGYS